MQEHLLQTDKPLTYDEAKAIVKRFAQAGDKYDPAPWIINMVLELEVPPLMSPKAVERREQIYEEYNYPSNPANAARIGYVAARRLQKDAIQKAGT